MRSNPSIAMSACFAAIFAMILLTSARAEAPTAVQRVVVNQPTDLSKTLTPEAMKAAQLKTCIQPSYDAWEKVKVGMTLEEVRALLGEPIKDFKPKSEAAALMEAIAGETLTDEQQAEDVKRNAEQGVIVAGLRQYGLIEFDAPAVPKVYQFGIVYADGKVFEKWSPVHGAALSRSDRPSTPRIRSPEFATWVSRGEILDLRWDISTGAYPIQYEVETQSFLGDEPPTWASIQDDVNYEPDDEAQMVPIPHMAISASYDIERWRVRAKNQFGESDWTPWRYYRVQDGFEDTDELTFVLALMPVGFHEGFLFMLDTLEKFEE